MAEAGAVGGGRSERMLLRERVRWRLMVLRGERVWWRGVRMRGVGEGWRLRVRWLVVHGMGVHVHVRRLMYLVMLHWVILMLLKVVLLMREGAEDGRRRSDGRRDTATMPVVVELGRVQPVVGRDGEWVSMRLWRGRRVGLLIRRPSRPLCGKVVVLVPCVHTLARSAICC